MRLPPRTAVSLCLLFLASCSDTADSEAKNTNDPSGSIPLAAPESGEASREGSGAAFTGSPSSGAPIVPSAPSVDDVGAAYEPTDPSVTSEPPPPPSTQAGTLTAGAWDDNRNYERFTDYRDALVQTLSGVLPIEDDEFDAAHALSSQSLRARQQLDVALVLDTTGSMGDELQYLQTEFSAIVSRIEAAYPDAAQRWALVLYRDRGDEYVVRSFDFSSDLETFRENLAAQSADGGGDLPEAPDEALVETNGLAWRSGDDVARIAFWVADAPHHAAAAPALADALREAQALDLHIYPVASSGVDELTELSMRSAAQLTQGRYLFLTNDSGVGGDHKEPTIPCYFVTRLDHAILRMVDIELGGVYREPAADELIRKGGDPQDGACALLSGGSAQAY